MKIKERFRIGKIRKAKEGHILMSQPTYGYNFIKRTPERQGYLEINESEAEIVKKIFSWVAEEGLTLRSVVRRLQELSIPPRKSKRGVWNTSTLSTMLRSKVYIGEGHFGASIAIVPENPLKSETYKKVKKTSRRMKSEEEWIKIKTPSIIDVDIFERANKKLKSNFEMCVRNRRNEYLLANKIWCTCGNRRAGEGAMKGKHLYYRCSDRVKNFPLSRQCYERGINAKIVDALLWQKLFKLMSSPELLIKQIQRWVQNRSKKIPSSTINIENAKKEISKLKEQEERYIKAYGAGAFSVEQLKEYSIPVKERISTIQNQIIKAEAEIKQLDERALPDNKQVETFTQSVIRTLKNLSFKAKKAIVDVIIDKVIANEKELKIWGYLPITIENNVAFFPKYRNRRSAKRGEVHAF
jgi:site-specific DNA recombinase